MHATFPTVQAELLVGMLIPMAPCIFLCSVSSIALQATIFCASVVLATNFCASVLLLTRHAACGCRALDD